ncbi:MAG TPA: ATP-binding protein [Acidobacteriota bacterium]|nr:ATP-binding protein [Acidobacteriota bacterium]
MLIVSKLKKLRVHGFSSLHPLPVPGSYIFALLAVAVAALLRSWLAGALTQTPFLAFYPALVLAAAFGGFGPGLVATIFSWLCVTWFFDSTPGYIGLSNPAEIVRLLVFLSGGLGVSLVSEAQLRSQKRLLKQSREIAELVQLTDAGPFMIRDAQDRIVHWSEGCARLYGYTSDQAVGRISHELLQTHFPEPLAEITETLNRKGQWEGELIHLRLDGTRITTTSLWILRKGYGAPVVLEINTDITRLKQAEDDLLRISRELERSNRDLESFAYIASHDLQEPLRTITGFLQLLEQKMGGQLDEKSRQYIDYAVDGSKRMHQMITDLLAYSRVSMQPFSPKRIRLNETLAQALSLTRKSIEDSGASIVVQDLPSVHADGSQMLQVFQNLIGNAIKFRSQHPLEIQVGARREQDSWLLYVKDNGIGLDPKQKDKIFQIFQRLHSRQKYPGSGIGLSICKKIVERHGGSIWVESIPDTGSTFYFTLPSD